LFKAEIGRRYLVGLTTLRQEVKLRKGFGRDEACREGVGKNNGNDRSRSPSGMTNKKCNGRNKSNGEG
jgi:hypothetical protein